jgi:peptidase C13-like protein
MHADPSHDTGGKTAALDAPVAPQVGPIAPTPAGGANPDPAPRHSGIRAVWRNLLAGWRLSLMRRVRREDFTASADAFAVLVVLNLVVFFVLGLMSVGIPGEFNFDELPRSLMFVPLTLAFGLVVERGGAGQGTMPVVSTALVAAGVVLSVVIGALDLLLQNQYLFVPSQRHWDVLLFASIAWWAAVVVAAVWRLASTTVRNNVAHVLAGLILLVAPAWWFPQSYLWVPASDPEYRKSAAAAGVVEEQAFYAQQGALERALSALEPERPGVADLYVLAAAFYAREDVFMKEVRVILDLFRTEFDAEGRSLALINNPQTAEEYPVASLTSLATALNHLGGLMNVEEDVLVLYLTSHGSEKHELAVEFPPLRLVPIDPQTLKAALDESGIKWKVVIVSACYSGGFVRALKDSQTMIITASAADRQSFGCGNESDFTYLARALFDEALRRTHSFEAAFEAAREAIARRERGRGFAPSEPQIAAGPAIREKLKEIERRLEARGRPGAAR